MAAEEVLAKLPVYEAHGKEVDQAVTALREHAARRKVMTSVQAGLVVSLLEDLGELVAELTRWSVKP